MNSKICSECKKEKSLSDFHKNGKGTYSKCKVCVKEANHEYYKNNKDKVSEHNKRYYKQPGIKEKRLKYCKKYRKENPECRQRQHANKLARMFNFDSTDEFNIFIDKLWEKQKGRCGICGIKLVRHGKKGNGMAIDHDHSDMIIRGLLCKSHNFAIGLLEDSAELCLAAAEYLRMSKASK